MVSASPTVLILRESSLVFARRLQNAADAVDGRQVGVGQRVFARDRRLGRIVTPPGTERATALDETLRYRIGEPCVEGNRPVETESVELQLMNAKGERQPIGPPRDEQQLRVVRHEVIDDDLGVREVHGRPGRRGAPAPDARQLRSGLRGRHGNLQSVEVHGVHALAPEREGSGVHPEVLDGDERRKIGTARHAHPKSGAADARTRPPGDLDVVDRRLEVETRREQRSDPRLQERRAQHPRRASHQNDRDRYADGSDPDQESASEQPAEKHLSSSMSWSGAWEAEVLARLSRNDRKFRLFFRGLLTLCERFHIIGHGRSRPQVTKRTTLAASLPGRRPSAQDVCLALLSAS